MCGRFVLASSPRQLADRFGAELAPEVEAGFPASFNVAPSATVLGLRRAKDGTRVINAYRWGLVPSWAKDPTVGVRMFNARAEGLAERPAFRRAFAQRRCAVLADGYWEWQKAPGRRGQPHYFRRDDAAPLALAGLYEHWRDVDGAWLTTCTVVTTAAPPVLAEVHDRMPAVLGEGALATWLDPGAEPDELAALLGVPDAGRLVHYRVDRRVGDVRNDDAGLLVPLADAPAG